MCEDSNQICLCPLEGVIDTMSKKWALLIVNALGNRQRLRFNQLMEELKGISPKMLADMLKELQKEQLIGRESFAEIPPRVEYFLTEDGIELRKAILPLLKWASKRDNFNKGKCVPVCQKMPAHQIK